MYFQGSAIGKYDDGTIVGVSDAKRTRLQIENKINDCLVPRPKFELEIQVWAGKNLIFLKVQKGNDAPYYYNQNTYKRSDTSTVPVDRSEIRRLVLSSEEQSYD